MMVLEVVDGQGRRRQVELNRPRLLIGREPSCDIHLPHPGVSRRHAQLQLIEPDRWLLQDLSSRNHVYVDNKPIQQIVLETRKPFRIADYWLALQEVSSARARLEEEAEADTDTSLGKQPEWVEQLYTYQRSLLSIEDPQSVLEKLAREFRRVLEPAVVAVGLARPDGYSWEIILSDDPAPQLRPFLQSADEKLLEDQSSFQCWTPSGKGNGETPTPAPPLCLLLPLKGRSGLIGHVYVAKPTCSPVPRTMQRYLSLLTAHSALMWDNLQLRSLREKQIEFEKELHHARQIQIDLFPPTFDVDPRVDIYAVNLPSAKVSGDYYDVIRTGPDTVAFIIADAMGHGMPAALMMAAVRAALRMGLSLDLPWPAVFQGLDELIGQARADSFVTGLVGLLDLQQRELSLVSAGHPLPSILLDGHMVEVPDSCLTRPWGLDLASLWQVGRLPLAGKRWSILCYTDGITDAAARSQRAFGAQRVADFHHKHFVLSAEDLCQGLLSEVAVQPGASSLGDDQTVLVLCSN